MDKRQYAVVLTLAVFAGLLGGVVSSWLFVGTPVFTQKTEVGEVIRAKEFWVEEDGNLYATLRVSYEEPGLYLYDKNRKGRAAFSMRAGEPRLELYDENGKTIWSAP